MRFTRRRRISELVESFMTEGVAGVVEAWGRIELHEVGFRAEFARPKLLFEPAGHLISTEALTDIHAVAHRYGVPVVPLPRPKHAGEWCRTREIGLASEVVEQSLLRDLRLVLRRTSRVSRDRRWLRVGVWPEVVRSPSGSPEEAYTHVNDLPGVQICTVRVRGPEAIAAFESEEFDPGRRLQLVRKATWDYESGGGALGIRWDPPRRPGLVPRAPDRPASRGGPDRRGQVADPKHRAS